MKPQVLIGGGLLLLLLLPKKEASASPAPSPFDQPDDWSAPPPRGDDGSGAEPDAAGDATDLQEDLNIFRAMLMTAMRLVRPSATVPEVYRYLPRNNSDEGTCRLDDPGPLTEDGIFGACTANALRVADIALYSAHVSDDMEVDEFIAAIHAGVDVPFVDPADGGIEMLSSIEAREQLGYTGWYLTEEGYI